MVSLNCFQRSTLLPGPTRRRTPAEYRYLLTYFCALDPVAAGCVASWKVLGGRGEYQIDLEQKAGGWQQWHCTCANAVFRAEPQGRVCKHVVGLVRELTGNEMGDEPQPGPPPAQAQFNN